jgi:hypothetical protein
VSKPITSKPDLAANWASGKPTYPWPITAIFMKLSYHLPEREILLLKVRV